MVRINSNKLFAGAIMVTTDAVVFAQDTFFRSNKVSKHLIFIKILIF